MRFKAGDIVRIKNDLVVNKKYNNYMFVDGMKKYRGEIVIVKHVLDYDRCYRISMDNGCFSWSEDMLEPYKDYRELLKTGVFGEMSDGRLFVVVNDLLVYDTGGYDRINSLDEFLCFSEDLYIVKAVKDCKSFNIYKAIYTDGECKKDVIYYNNPLEMSEKSLRYAFSIDELKELYEEKIGRKIVIKE